jgi:hypothetical protein
VAVIIGIDPHKQSHTAVAIDAAEAQLGTLRVRASTGQASALVEWAAAWPDRTWAVEGAGGLGHLLAQQLVAAFSDHFKINIFMTCCSTSRTCSRRLAQKISEEGAGHMAGAGQASFCDRKPTWRTSLTRKVNQCATFPDGRSPDVAYTEKGGR